MHKPQQDVREFHRTVADAPTSPAEPKLRNPELRARLILEEAIETVEALLGMNQARDAIFGAFLEWSVNYPKHESPDIVGVIDGVIDTLVVCYGTLEDMGIDGEPFWDEVMRANMAKAGGPIRADGKRLKPPGWQPPDIAGVFERVRSGK